MRVGDAVEFKLRGKKDVLRGVLVDRGRIYCADLMWYYDLEDVDELKVLSVPYKAENGDMVTSDHALESRHRPVSPHIYLRHDNLWYKRVVLSDSRIAVALGAGATIGRHKES